MNRKQLAHVCRAAAEVTADTSLLVIGSQSILGTFGERMLPIEATRSIEADIAFFDDADGSKADAVDGALGEGSSFHEEYDYYAQGVSVETAILPAGWRERLVRFQNKSTGKARRMCLDPHDLAASKLAAGREKDLEFVGALVKRGLLSHETLIERVDQLETNIAAIRRRARERAESIGKT